MQRCRTSSFVVEGISRFKAPFSGPYSASIPSNLRHIFNPTGHPSAVVDIAQKLVSSNDPDLLMAWAVTIRVRAWRHMTSGMYKCVIAELKSWKHPPWEENVLTALEAVKNDLKDSQSFKIFSGPHPNPICVTFTNEIPGHMQAPAAPPEELEPLNARLPTTSRSQPGGWQPDARLPATSPSPRGLRLHATLPSHPSGLPAFQPPGAIPATSISQPDMWLQATLPLQPGARLPTTSHSQPGWQPDARLPETSSPLTLPALAFLPNQGLLLPFIEAGDDFIRLHIPLHVLYHFLPLETIYLDSLRLVPSRAEALYSTKQSLVQIEFQGNWDLYVMRIELSPGFVLNLVTQSLRWEP